MQERPAAWIILLALFLNSFAPALMAGSQQDYEIVGFNGKISICSPDGPQTIDVADLNEKSQHEKAKKCPMCVAAKYNPSATIIDETVPESVQPPEQPTDEYDEDSYTASLNSFPKRDPPVA